MTKIAINKGGSLRILFAFKPERLLKGETGKRRDLFPRCKRFFLDRTPLSHGSSTERFCQPAATSSEPRLALSYP
jgi:hypothetical protein